MAVRGHRDGRPPEARSRAGKRGGAATAERRRNDPELDARIRWSASGKRELTPELGQRVYELYDSGMTRQQVADKLNADGVPPLRGNKTRWTYKNAEYVLNQVAPNRSRRPYRGGRKPAVPEVDPRDLPREQTPFLAWLAAQGDRGDAIGKAAQVIDPLDPLNTNWYGREVLAMALNEFDPEVPKDVA